MSIFVEPPEVSPAGPLPAGQKPGPYKGISSTHSPLLTSTPPPDIATTKLPQKFHTIEYGNFSLLLTILHLMDTCFHTDRHVI